MEALGWAQVLALLVVAQRLAELAWARRNERRLRAAGAVEHGRRHYPLFVALHAAWLLALFLMVPPERRPDWWLLGLFALLQLARLWVVASLGRFWTTRVITLPDAPLVRRGPYRWIAHPNYLVVALELAVLPLAFGAWLLALAASLANLPLTWHRIRIEERALAGRGSLPHPLPSSPRRRESIERRRKSATGTARVRRRVPLDPRFRGDDD